MSAACCYSQVLSRWHWTLSVSVFVYVCVCVSVQWTCGASLRSRAKSCLSITASVAWLASGLTEFLCFHLLSFEVLSFRYLRPAFCSCSCSCSHFCKKPQCSVNLPFTVLLPFPDCLLCTATETYEHCSPKANKVVLVNKSYIRNVIVCLNNPQPVRASDDDDVRAVCVSVWMCVSEKAFGFGRTERSSFLLLCNLIGKIQAAVRTHTCTHCAHSLLPRHTCTFALHKYAQFVHKLVITICCSRLPIICLSACVCVLMCVKECFHWK